MKPSIDWLYFRPGCETCDRSRAFLADHQVAILSSTSTKQQIFPEAEARAVLQGIERVVASKGKKVVTVDLKKERPDWKTLAALLIGPTGKLRAPVVRTGKTLVVGFSDEMYRALLG